MKRLFFTAVILSTTGLTSFAQAPESEDEDVRQEAAEPRRGHSLDEILAAIKTGVPLPERESPADDEGSVRSGDDAREPSESAE
jgi:hypothetical protein